MARSALRVGLVSDSECNRHRLVTVAIFALDRAHTNAWELFRRIVESGRWNVTSYAQEDRASVLLAAVRSTSPTSLDSYARRVRPSSASSVAAPIESLSAALRGMTMLKTLRAAASGSPSTNCT